MRRNKSPVDELVDGIDAIGSILDENLPKIKSRIDNLTERNIDSAQTLTEIRRIMKESDEIQTDLKKSATNLDIRVEEVLGTLNALARRMDQLQKSMLDMTESILNSDSLSYDTGLSDTVKSLEDRLDKLEGKRLSQDNPNKRF